MHNKKVLIDAIRNLSNPKKTNKNKNYFDISNSQDSDFISAKDGVDTPIYKKVSVKPSPIAGRGLFAEQSIRAGEPIGVSHIRKKFMRGGEEYQAPFPSTTLGYYNHSKEPNVYEVDKGGHIVMVASRDINPGDEITANYDQNEIKDLENSSDFKRGGGLKSKKYSKSLQATNKFFREHSFFEKPKKLSKKRIYDPNAMYYRDGGLTVGTSTSYPSGIGVGALANYVPSQMANLKLANSFKFKDVKTPLEVSVGTPLGGVKSRSNTYQGFQHPNTNESAVSGPAQSSQDLINSNKANFNNWQETTKGAPIDFRVKQSFYGITQNKDNPLRGFASIQGGYHPQTGFNAGAEGGVNLVLSRNGQANRYFSNRGLIPKQTVFVPQLTMGFGAKQKHQGWNQDTLNEYENLLNQDAQNNTTNSLDYLNEEGKKGNLTGSRTNFAIRPQFTIESRPTRSPLTVHGTIGANMNMAAGNRAIDSSGGTRSKNTLYGELGVRYPVDKMFDKKSKAKSKIQEVQDREQEYEKERPVKPVEQKEPKEQTEWIGEHPRWLQDGGEKDGMNGMMKARLAYANEFGNPAAKRMINIPDNPYQFENGDSGTHYMSSMDNYAVPQIQDENGQLMLGDYGPDSREAMRFDSDEDANYFAEHYKDVSPGFMELELTPEEIEEYKKGGYIVEDYDPSIPELNTYAEGGSKKIKRKKTITKPGEWAGVNPELVQPGEEAFPLLQNERGKQYYEPIALKDMTQEELDALNKDYEEELAKEAFEKNKPVKEDCGKGTYWNGKECLPYGKSSYVKIPYGSFANPATLPSKPNYTNHYRTYWDPQQYAEEINDTVENIQAGVDWYKDWYSKRKQLPQFAEVAQKRLNLISDPANSPLHVKIRPRKLMDETESADYYNPYTGTPTTNKIIKAPMLPKKWYQSLMPNDPVIDDVLIHEMSHFFDDFARQPRTSGGTMRSMEGEINKLIDPSGKPLPKELIFDEIVPKSYRTVKPKDVYQDSWDHDIKDVTEIRAALNQWRMKNRIDPTKDYSVEEIQEIIKNGWKDVDLIKIIRNDPAILKKLNDAYVKNDSKQFDEYAPQMAKYGGTLDTYAEGGWLPKAKLGRVSKSIKTIEPKPNKITIGNAKDLATNSSAAQAINAVKDRTLQLWNTSEGQRRLQNLINTTPSLQANLFFDSKDMVSDLANTKNINQEIIDYEAIMDNIINEQNQVDSYYDQNLMDKNDYFNTTVDLDTKLKKTEEEYAQLLEHAKTKGGAFYDRNENAFVINPQYFNNAALPKVGMHEVIHLPGLKRGVGRTSIDEKLGGLDLKDQLDFDFSNASNNNSFYKHLNRKGNYLGGAKSYYNLNGGFERSPFLAELREDMLENNIIKHPYQKVNSKMIKDYYRDYLKKEDKYPLRIFDIMTNKPKNFSLLSNTMNELPSLAPYVVGAGAATLLDNPFDAESNSEDGKYAEGGEPCPDGYIRNNSTGECVLEIAPEQTPAEEWYKNWYANRVIQDEEGQKLLNEARPKLLKRTENFPEVDYDAKGLGDASGMYNPMTGKISLNSSQMTSPFIRDEVLFHEKGHYITSPSMLDPEMDTYKKMKNHPVHKLREYETGLVNQALVPKNKVSKEEGKFYDYISGNYGEEMSKRIMELRRLAGFKPDQVITDDDLKNFYQKAKTKGWTDPNSDAFVPALIDFQRFINSPQDLKMLLNKMAKNESRGIDEYAPQQAQDGGEVDYELGDKIDKATMEKLKKLGYTFQKIK